MPTLEIVITRDKSSGRFHKRYAEVQRGFDAERPLQTARRIMVDERCNLDSAGDYEVVATSKSSFKFNDGLEGVDEGLLCGWCWPRGEDSTDG